ncbi:MAG: diacylglycerol kinase family protein [Ginsengibacter sp.]
MEQAQMKNNIALLINPLPGKKRIHVANEIIKALSERKISFTSFSSTWPADINMYKEAWVIGGDGTLNYFLNFYKNIQIPIAIFKAGTGNDFAWKLYGEKSIIEQLDHVLKAVPKQVDAAKCNEHIFINGVGIGFDGEVVKAIKTIRFLGRHSGYLWVVLQKIFSFKEYNYHIKFNDQFLAEKFLLVIITNSSRVGGGFMVSPTADITDGKLNMVLCKPLSVLTRLRNLPVIEKGKHLYKKYILHAEIESVEIVCDQEIFAHLDGELINRRSFNISVMPKHYLFKY